MVYTDKIHLVADTLEELHGFAAMIGLKREWFQEHPTHPHYDIWGSKLTHAYNMGVKVVSSKFLLKKANKLNCSLSVVINSASVCNDCEFWDICDADRINKCEKL